VGEQEHNGQMIGRSRLRAHVEFPRQSGRPTLLALAELITAMRDEYRPLTVSFIGDNANFVKIKILVSHPLL
jgi:hypothetical protein